VDCDTSRVRHTKRCEKKEGNTGDSNRVVEKEKPRPQGGWGRRETSQMEGNPNESKHTKKPNGKKNAPKGKKKEIGL